MKRYPRPTTVSILLARGSELAAQAADVHIDRPRLDEPIVPPDTLEETIARDDAVLVLDQIRSSSNSRRVSEPVRHRRQWRRRRNRREPLAAIEGRAHGAVVAGRAAAAQHGAHPRGQLAEAERLGDVVVGAVSRPATRSSSLVRAVSMMIGTCGASARDRRMRQTSRPLRTGRFRSRMIRSGGCSVTAASAASPGDDLGVGVAAPLERVLDESGDVVLVFDDEDASWGTLAYHANTPPRVANMSDRLISCYGMMIPHPGAIMNTSSVTAVLMTLFSSLRDGAPSSGAYILNRGDEGAAAIAG